MNDILQAYSEQRAKISAPASLDEAITRLDAEWSDDDKKTFAAIPEDMIGRRYHMWAGHQIINSWGLWPGSVLAEYFNRLGIVHPDDMSAIILTSFHRKLNGEDIRLKEQVKRYKAYWKQQKKPKRKKEKIKRYRANHIAHPRQIVAILSER